MGTLPCIMARTGHICSKIQYVVSLHAYLLYAARTRHVRFRIRYVVSLRACLLYAVRRKKKKDESDEDMEKIDEETEKIGRR